MNSIETEFNTGIHNQYFDTTQPKGSRPTEFGADFIYERSYTTRNHGNGLWSIRGSTSIPQDGTLIPTVKNEAKDLMCTANTSESVVIAFDKKHTGRTYTAFGTEHQVKEWEARMKELNYSQSRRKQVGSNSSVPRVRGSLI